MNMNTRFTPEQHAKARALYNQWDSLLNPRPTTIAQWAYVSPIPFSHCIQSGKQSSIAHTMQEAIFSGFFMSHTSEGAAHWHGVLDWIIGRPVQFLSRLGGHDHATRCFLEWGERHEAGIPTQAAPATTLGIDLGDPKEYVMVSGPPSPGEPGEYTPPKKQGKIDIDELKELLQENLSVSLDTNYDGVYVSISVNLAFGGQTISCAYGSVSIK